MNNVVKIGILFFCLFMFTACSSSGSEQDRDMSGALLTTERSTIEQHNEDARIDQVETESGNDSKSIVQANSASAERKVIYTAHLDVIVANFSEAEKKVTDIVRNENGYIVSSNIHRDDNENKSGHLTVKIPQAKFDTFLKDIDELSVEVKNQAIQGEDVTEEYVDLNARLKAKQDVKERLETFLKDATTTKDLLAVSEQIGNVQEEIEQLEGRLNYLKNQTDFSTVTISMTERSLKVGELGSKEQNTWVRAKQLLVSTINGIISVASGIVVVLIGLSPIFIPVVVIIVGIFLYRKKKKREEKGSD